MTRRATAIKWICYCLGALVLVLVLVVLMPYAALIPMPCIAAILFSVAYNMSQWRAFVRLCRCAPRSDLLVLVLTFGFVLLTTDVAIGRRTRQNALRAFGTLNKKWKEFTRCLVIRMHMVNALDVTAFNALENLYDECAKKGIRVIFSHVNEQPMHVMEHAGFVDKVGRENFCRHIQDAIALAAQSTGEQAG